MASWPAFAPGHHTHARLLAQVSALYYLDGNTQAEIAQRLRLSRVKVSRLLCAARDAGIARIVVSPPRGVLAALEEELEVRFELREVRIVPASAGGSTELTRRQLGLAAAADLARTVRPGQSLGLVGMELLPYMIDAVAPIVASDVRVVQGVGWEAASSPQRTLMSLVIELARRINGSAVVLPVPYVVHGDDDRQALDADPQITGVLRLLDTLDTLYTEIVPAASDLGCSREGLKPMGQIARRHFDPCGRMLDTIAVGHLVGITVDQLRRARHIVALAHGPSQAPVIAAALRTALVGTLITDELTARAIVALPSRV